MATARPTDLGTPRDAGFDGFTPAEDRGTTDGSTPADGHVADAFEVDAFTEDDGGRDGGASSDRTVCGTLAPLASGDACEITAGSTTVLLRGTVLGPDAVFAAGEVLVEGSGPDGHILCVGCDCASRPAATGATVVSCPEGVISPGLVDGLSYPRYATNAPAPASTERYEHRHDWRTGSGGHTEINASLDSSGNAATIHELRMLLAGATSTAGSNGTIGSLGGARNLAQERLGARVSVRIATFPLNDVGGDSHADCSGYSYGSAPPSGTTFLPVVAEGIDERARNELDCLTTGAGGDDQVGSETAVEYRGQSIETGLMRWGETGGPSAVRRRPPPPFAGIVR